MTLQELHALFELYEPESHKFENVENKRSQRPDLHAFLLLDELWPGNRDIVSSAEHDEIYLGVTPDALAEVATPEIVRELRRCGVRYDRGTDSLMMFV